jgi:hypothetical protein
MENRADHGTIRGTALAVKELRPFGWCRRLLDQLHVLYDGRTLGCCVDWEQKEVMGDLRTTALADIWHGPAYLELRRRFAAGEIEGTLCQSCRKQS